MKESELSRCKPALCMRDEQLEALHRSELVRVPFRFSVVIGWLARSAHSGYVWKRRACIGRVVALPPHCLEPRCLLNQKDQSNDTKGG